MTQYEIYTFILCLIVFISLTALFSILLGCLVKLSVCLIRHGAEDEVILKEYIENNNSKKHLHITDVISALFSVLVCIALFVSFVFSVYLLATEDKAANGIPSLKVVQSSSMSYANAQNTYLQKNNITDHLQTFDLIVTEKLPDEFDLELYDVVVYEQEGEMIIHRIVEIEEPNEKHPDCRHFKLQGDAVRYPDIFPVKYSQMRGIWNGSRIPFVGSFIMFMQSPAGWLCILLIVFALIATPLVEKKLQREKEKRLQELTHGSRQMPVHVALPTNSTPIDKPLHMRSAVISHFRLLLKVQKQDPKVEMFMCQTRGCLQKTNQKGKKRK